MQESTAALTAGSVTGLSASLSGGLPASLFFDSGQRVRLVVDL